MNKHTNNCKNILIPYNTIRTYGLNFSLISPISGLYSFLPLHYLEFGTCPFGWMEYGMSCYQINTDTKSYYSADLACQQKGASLVDITSNVEQAYIASKVNVPIAWTGKCYRN